MTTLMRDLACSVALILTACGATRSHAPDTVDRPTEAETSITELVNTTMARMHERYQLAQRIELDIAWGQLEIARQDARELAALREPAAVARWQPYFESVRLGAQQVNDAPDLRTAAAATAELGARCASCHLAIDARPKIPADPQPEPGAATAPQMRTHQWAAAQMWTGLIGPDLDRWFAGAQALSIAPLYFEPRDPAMAPQTAADLEKLRAAANLAMTPLTAGDRAHLFGELLTTCADCHALVRDR